MHLVLLLLCWIAAAAEPVLPTIASEVSPVYPERALAKGETGSVVLRLEVDERGTVTAVEILEPAEGPFAEEFGEAAIAAARAFQFRPGMDENGRPAAAVIGYRVVFEPEQAAVLSMEGEVREAGTREKLPGVTIVGLGPDGTRIVAITDEEGGFSFAGLAEGEWQFDASGDGLRTEPFEVEVRGGSVGLAKVFVVREKAWTGEVDAEITVVGRRETEVTERVLSRDEIRYLPGTGGDVVKVVQSLPGVARAPLGVGQLLIRGTAPEDSAYYLDGGRVPIVFHFAGLSTVLPSDILDEVSLLPGNYGARYGRTLGGVVDLRTSEELPERSRGYVSVDLFQGAALIEQRLSDKTALVVSGRRSWIDAILNPVLNNALNSSVRAPVFQDAQARLLHRTDAGDAIDFLLLGSRDQFRIVGDDNDTDEVQIGLATTFSKLRFRWTRPIGDWRHEMIVIGGPENQGFEIAPDGAASESTTSVGIRDEFYLPSTEEHPGLRVGVDLLGTRFAYSYDVPGFPPPEEGEFLSVSPSFYAEPQMEGGPVTVTPGLRVDPLLTDDGYSQVALDPRLSVRLDVVPELGVTASTGKYSQFPLLRQIEPEEGNPNLGPAQALQSSVGVSGQLTSAWDYELTGFHSKMEQLVVGREDAFRFFSGPPPTGPLDTDDYANDGTGRIYGSEGLLRFMTEQTTGWLAVTFARSFRTDRPTDNERLFEYDQPWAVIALFSHQLPKRWRIGARYRYGSGNPYTPVVNRTYDLQSRTYRPVYGPTDSTRLPAFWQLDVRIDKEWVFRKWQFTSYLDLQNATNRANPDVIGFSEDFSEEQPINSLPVIPAFGLRGEW